MQVFEKLKAKKQARQFKHKKHKRRLFEKMLQKIKKKHVSNLNFLKIIQLAEQLKKVAIKKPLRKKTSVFKFKKTSVFKSKKTSATTKNLITKFLKNKLLKDIQKFTLDFTAKIKENPEILTEFQLRMKFKYNQVRKKLLKNHNFRNYAQYVLQDYLKKHKKELLKYRIKIKQVKKLNLF